MLHSMRRALIVGAVTVAGALGVSAMASAAAWDVDGTPVGGAPGVAIGGEGTFQFTAPLGPVTSVQFACEADVEADVWNASGVGAGSLTSFDVRESTCVVSGVSNCAISGVSPSLPWNVSTSGSSVTLSNVSYTFTLVNSGGGGCALAGSRLVAGSVTGSWTQPGSWDPEEPAVLSWSNATGLSIVGWVPLFANGALWLQPASGGGLYLR